MFLLFVRYFVHSVHYVVCFVSVCAIYMYVPFFCMYHLHVLCIVHVFSLFVVVQIKYNVKRFELFKIRRYIKCPLLLLLLYPKYLSELLNVYTSAWPLRSSSDPNMLTIATARTKACGERAFAYQGPINWNRVSSSIRIVDEKETLEKHLDSIVQQAGVHNIKISTLTHYLS